MVAGEASRDLYKYQATRYTFKAAKLPIMGVDAFFDAETHSPILDDKCSTVPVCAFIISSWANKYQV